MRNPTMSLPFINENNTKPFAVNIQRNRVFLFPIQSMLSAPFLTQLVFRFLVLLFHVDHCPCLLALN